MLEGLQETIGGIGEDVTTFVSEHPIATAAIGAGVVGAGVGVALIATSGKKSKRKTSKRGRKRDRTFKSKQKHERRYKRKRKYKVYGKKGWINPKRKRKNSGKRRGKVYYARKTGQPYILLASGKAKFIKGKRRKR
jgi:hypothetical protein